MDYTSERFKRLYDVISTDDFLSMKSLGGEIPFFIFAYDAQYELFVQKSVRQLKNKLETSGVTVCEINLYDIVIDILEEELGMDEVFGIEKDMDKEEFKDALQSVLEIHEVLMPKIKTLIDESDAKVNFLTNIGLVFPYIRSHTILNNLQNVAKQSPTITFFPGKYDGHSLNLFGLLKDDNYYRAFNIDKIKV